MRKMNTKYGNAAANQFLDDKTIKGISGQVFQSYSSNIALKPFDGSKTILDERYWDYSATTGNYRNQFLGEGIAETRAKIETGVYVLANLN